MKVLFNRLRTMTLVLLLIGMFLPFSSCTTYYDADGERVLLEKITNSEGETTDFVKEYAVTSKTTETYIWEYFNSFDLEAFLLGLAFIWPVILSVYYHSGHNSRLQISRRVLEPILALLSSAYIFVLADILATPRSGAYVILSAYSLYLIAWIGEVWQLWRNRKSVSQGEET